METKNGATRMTWRHGDRPTIGVLTGWQVFEDARPNRFLERMFSGIRAAAQEKGFNLMFSCGVEHFSLLGGKHACWPIPTEDADYLPVGHYNTDGLIVIPPVWFESRVRYLDTLKEADFPLVFAGYADEGHAVVVDNVVGIREAVAHLVQHGHQQILFIAGEDEPSGDSYERLLTFQTAVREFGLSEDPELITYGYHGFSHGRKATERVLKAGIPFTAVLASNDPSALGACEAILAHGLNIPGDVAIIGFDDQLEAQANIPALSTVQYPLFDAGYELVNLLEKVLFAPDQAPARVSVPTRLVLRQSCGCSSHEAHKNSRSDDVAVATLSELEHVALKDLVALRPRHALSLPAETDATLCTNLAHAFIQSLASQELARFTSMVNDLITAIDLADADVQLWQERLSHLRGVTHAFLQATGATLAEGVFVHRLLDLARVALSESAQRRAHRQQIREDRLANYLTYLSAKFLNAQTNDTIIELLLDSLRIVNIRHAHVALFEQADDPYDTYRVAPWGAEATFGPHLYRSTDFPPPGIFPPGEPFSLALLPLVYQNEQMGFVAFDTQHLEPCSAIARQLAATFVNTRRHEHILELSHRDGLTGLHNRRYLDTYLTREFERSLRYGTQLTILLLDLDHFKIYNDSYGHVAGDEALQKLANCINHGRRSTDVAARFGGEEFIVVLPETDLPGAMSVAEGIRVAVEVLTGLAQPITTSIGVARRKDVDVSPADLLRRADRALYEAKKAGRNRVHVAHAETVS
jgi:diguanylate cyclase (GGDEF)-like protein